jgi:hypothetical protein
MPFHIADRIFRIISGKIHPAIKIKHLVEDNDWDQEILKGEKWVDSFCWSVLGLSALYFAFVCLTMILK